MAEKTPEPPYSPFYPHKGDPEKEKGNEVRDHERPSPVRGRLNREAQEIPEANGRTGNSQDYSDPCAPGFSLFCHTNAVYHSG
jgi:hypothetical protein